MGFNILQEQDYVYMVFRLSQFSVIMCNVTSFPPIRLGGALVDVSSIQVVGERHLVVEGYASMQVQADFHVFCPSQGSDMEGTVNKVTYISSFLSHSLSIFLPIFLSLSLSLSLSVFLSQSLCLSLCLFSFSLSGLINQIFMLVYIFNNLP